VQAGFYTCAPADGGGVHTNSGVPNHGFALIVDGGTFNGHTVTGIGMTKAAHIYYRAMTTYQHPATDFADHADALEQSCADLVGQSVTDLFGGAPQTITAGDCAQVAEMTAAVLFRTPPAFCNFQPMLQAGNPPLCPAGGGIPQTFFFDNFESAPTGWTFGTYGTTVDFTPRQWTWSGALPSGRSGSAFFGTDPTSAPARSAATSRASSRSPARPSPCRPRARPPRLRPLDVHRGSWDGGNVKISVNGGAFVLVADGDYTFNSYNAAIDPTSTNPMFGQAAFTGGDGGSVSGSWARSLVNLAPYAAAGDTVQLRYDMGTDGCTGFFGWYVDDVRLYSCAAATGTPALAIGDASVVEGNASTVDLVLPVTLSTASGSPVTVDYATADGTAGAGDYTPATGTLTFAPGELSHGVTVSVVGDTTFEPDEFFFANLSNATGGATILDGQGVGTIVNDDAVTAAGGARSEIIHGTRVQKALTPVGTAAGADFYYVANQPFTSYEVVVDATSGDLGTAGPALTRVASDGTTVLQSSVPVGTGSSRSLRWSSTAAGNEYVRVQSSTCTTDCGPDDVYRLRAYETTYSIPRFNNSGTQVTVLLLQNPTNETVTGHIYFWSAAGVQLHDEPVSARSEGAAGLQLGHRSRTERCERSHLGHPRRSVRSLAASRSPSNRPPASASTRRWRRGCPSRVVVGPYRPGILRGPGPFSFSGAPSRATSSALGARQQPRSTRTPQRQRPSSSSRAVAGRDR
jgi:hypothetical protein